MIVSIAIQVARLNRSVPPMERSERLDVEARESLKTLELCRREDKKVSSEKMERLVRCETLLLRGPCM